MEDRSASPYWMVCPLVAEGELPHDKIRPWLEDGQDAELRFASEAIGGPEKPS